jgi:hypothetical protein
MGERTSVRRRVLIEDARRNGHHLRATWHAETRQFVFSTWRDDVCTGATRIAVEDVAELAGLVVDGLADSAGTSPPPAVALAPGGSVEGRVRPRRSRPGVVAHVPGPGRVASG